MAELSLGGEPIFVDVGKQYHLCEEISEGSILEQALLRNPEQKDIISKSLYKAICNTTPIETPKTQWQEVIEIDLENEPDPEAVPTPAPESKKKATNILLVQKQRIRCPECQRYTSESEEQMQRHIRKIHRGENPFQCYMCDYSTYNKSLFEEHVRIHQGIKPFKCSICAYRSASKKNVKKHELIHRPDNPLKCQKCPFIARHPKALRSHEELCLKGKNHLYVCRNCSFSTQNHKDYLDHVCPKLKKRPFPCTICPYAAETKSRLRQHKKTCGITKRLFSCSICDWSSASMPKILLHLIHHPNQKVNSAIDTTILQNYGILGSSSCVVELE